MTDPLGRARQALLASSLLVAAHTAAAMQMDIGPSNRSLPPTLEQTAARLATIPRCPKVPAPRDDANDKVARSQADRIADSMWRLQQQFPNLACKED